MTCGLSRPLSSVWMWNVWSLYLTLLLKPTCARRNAGRASSRSELRELVERPARDGRRRAARARPRCPPCARTRASRAARRGRCAAPRRAGSAPPRSLAPFAAHAARTATASSGRPLPSSHLATRDAAARAWARPRVIDLHHHRGRRGGASSISSAGPALFVGRACTLCAPTRAPPRRAPTWSGTASSPRWPTGARARSAATSRWGSPSPPRARRPGPGSAQSAEATTLLGEGRPLPAAEVDDVREAIERARVGGVLAPAELRARRADARAPRARSAASSPRARRRSRRSSRRARTDPTLDEVADEISGCFEVDGALADRASPRLRELRGEWRAARQRMLSRMEDLMAGTRRSCRTAS